MKPIKFKRVEIRKPKWDSNPAKSKTNNHGWRQGLFIIFEDYNGNEFDYMPRWDELDAIMWNKDQVEKINKELCVKNNGTQQTNNGKEV